MSDQNYTIKFSITNCNTVVVGPKCPGGRSQHVKGVGRGLETKYSFLSKPRSSGPPFKGLLSLLSDFSVGFKEGTCFYCLNLNVTRQGSEI